MENPNNNNLSQDLITEILLRLPVKSLLRFKCVSKEWNTLIGSLAFANQHFAHESNQEHLLLVYYKTNKEKYAWTLYVDDMLSTYEEPNHEILETLYDIMGPLNGVFCVINDFGKIVFYNFAMRQLRLLPDLVHSRYINRSRLSLDCEVFGFGLDPLSGDFKLVCIQTFWDKENNTLYYPCIIFIYNSDSDSWKHFEEADAINSNCKICESFLNTYLNEVYYWLMEFNVDNHRTYCILAFDMRHDKFRRIEAPNDIEFINVDLGLYGDSLAFFNYDEEYIDVWVMEREGYWTYSFTSGPDKDLYSPLGFWKKNVIFVLKLESLRALSTDDVDFKMLRNFEGDTIDESSSRAFVYKESLISVKRRGEQALFMGCFL